VQLTINHWSFFWTIPPSSGLFLAIILSLKLSARVFSLTDRLDKAANNFSHDYSTFESPNHSVNIFIQASLLDEVSLSILVSSLGLTPSWRPISNHLVAMFGTTNSVILPMSSGNVTLPAVNNYNERWKIIINKKT